MEKEGIEVPERTHDQPAEGGREQAQDALGEQPEPAETAEGDGAAAPDQG